MNKRHGSKVVIAILILAAAIVFGGFSFGNYDELLGFLFNGILFVFLLLVALRLVDSILQVTGFFTRVLIALVVLPVGMAVLIYILSFL